MKSKHRIRFPDGVFEFWEVANIATDRAIFFRFKVQGTSRFSCCRHMSMSARRRSILKQFWRSGRNCRKKYTRYEMAWIEKLIIKPQRIRQLKGKTLLRCVPRWHSSHHWRKPQRLDIPKAPKYRGKPGRMPAFKAGFR